jgi:alkylation response protein AidB-like acyl-CoA dehydrogenase
VDFRLTEEQQSLQTTARRFAVEQMTPVARELERTATPVPHEWLRRYAEMGFLGINVAAEYGGMGLGNLEALLVIEEFAKVSSAVAFPIFESNVGPVRAIEHFASEALKRRVLPAVCRGDLVVAVAMSEPDAGSALTDLKTTAHVEGDEIVINGQKRWSSGSGHSGGYVVYCRMSDSPGAAGIGAVYVEKDIPGLTFGAPEQLLGFRGIPSADIFFDAVRVPQENLIVPAGGFKKLMEAFDLERCGNATMCLGIAASALEDALQYVQARQQFGKPIVDFQAVQLKLADMAMKVEAARLVDSPRRAKRQRCVAFDAGEQRGQMLCQPDRARGVRHGACSFWGRMAIRPQFSMEQRLRDGWGWGIAGGTIDIQMINIASALGGTAF